MTDLRTRTVYRVTALFDAPDPTCQERAAHIADRLGSIPNHPDKADAALISVIHLVARVCATTCTKLIPRHLVDTPLAYYDSWRAPRTPGIKTATMPPSEVEWRRIRELLAAATKKKKGPSNGSTPAR